MEVYQWILRKNGFTVQDRCYFVYCRVNKDNGFAQGKLSFDIKVQPYDANADWVDGKIVEAKRILDGDLPESSAECSYCKYVRDTK